MALPGDLVETSFGPWEIALLVLYPILLAGVVVIDAVGGVVVALAGSVPLVGSPLRNWAQGGFNTVRGWLDGLMAQNLAAYNGLVDRAYALWAALEGVALGLPREFYGALWRTVYLTLPAAVDQGLSYAEGLISAAEARADGFALNLEAALRALIVGAEATAAADLGAVRAETLSLVQGAEADAANLAAKAEGEAGALFQQAEADLAGAVAGVETELRAAERQIEADLAALASEAGREVAAARGAVAAGAADLAALDARVNQAAHDLGAQITGFEQLLQNEIDSVLKSGPWAALVAASEAGEAMIRAEVRTLVVLSAAEIRKELGNAEAIRAKYGPQVRAALADLRKP